MAKPALTKAQQWAIQQMERQYGQPEPRAVYWRQQGDAGAWRLYVRCEAGAADRIATELHAQGHAAEVRADERAE